LDAINTNSPKNLLAQKYIRENTSDLAVSHQNILESLRVLTHPKLPKPLTYDQAMRAISRIADCVKLISPSPETIYTTLLLIKKYHLKSDAVFDAYLASTALTNSITTIATDNTKDFSTYKEISTINPFNCPFVTRRQKAGSKNRN